MHLIIDGDSLIHAAAWAAERTTWWASIGGQRVSPESITSNRDVKKWIKDNVPADKRDAVALQSDVTVDNEGVAIGTLNNAIKKIVSVSGAHTWTIHLSDPSSSWRREYTKEEGIRLYKEDRDNRPKPVHGRACWFHAVEQHAAVINQDSEEADDECSRIMYQAWKNGDENDVMVSHIDKDLDQIPGWHFNFNTHKAYHLTLDQAIRNFYKQVLMGDSGDCVDGLKGIGPVKADKILSEYHGNKHWSQAVHEAYESRGLDDQLIHTANLVWLDRDGERGWHSTLIEELYYGAS